MALAIAPASGLAADPSGFMVQPSKVDPAVVHFDDPSVVLLGGGKGSPLVVFMPGTGGKPQNQLPFLRVIADQGYRVISLEYDDTPAVSQVCPQSPDLACSAKFREMRIYGTGAGAVVSNSPAEAIATRLVRLLQALAQLQPDQGWDQFLDNDQPRWDQIVVSGLSQGAGMAAFIAKRNLVRRAVLFSSPWDVAGPAHDPAPWLSDQSATPPDRWFAEYHTLELTAPLIRAAYSVLAIPADHLLVFDKGLPSGPRNGRSPNPYHVSTISNPAYADEWRQMFGRADDAPP